jgi:hypothetical protein
VRLNERVNDEDGNLDLGNSMPTWGPLTATGTYWLAFSSLRAYSDLRPADAKQDQLFVSGLDPSLDDPGFAAWWAPFQSMGQGNHRAFFTPTAPDRACAVAMRAADQSCSELEICDNGRDDDCDCVVDDCSREICDDGVDNDGDGKTDKMDLACAGP